MESELVCWKCGASLGDLPLPLARLAECRACRAQLHVCKLCEFFDPDRANQCREPVAEFVQDKERANFCGYFRPRPNARLIDDRSRARAAQADLESLFGIAPGPEGEGTLSAADEARKKLDELFKK